MVINKEKRLETLLVIVAALIGAWFIFEKKWLLLVAFGLAIIALFIPLLGDLLTKGWLKFSELLGFVMSKVLLGAVFFIFLTPISWLYRLFSKDSLQLKRHPETYWKDRNHSFTKKDLENTW